MPQKLIKCAVVGLGVGEQHALSILRDPSLELVHLVEHDEERAKKFIKDNNLNSTVISEYKSVIDDKSVEMISLASFDDDHYEQIISALGSNKHLFVEKPLCQNNSQLEHIVTQFHSSKSFLTSNLVLRNAPLYKKIRKMIKNGELGEVYGFDGDYLYGRLHKITHGWRKDVENYSVMEGGGIHIIDLMLFLTGEKPFKVSSVKNKIVTRSTDFKYHDFHASTFEFTSGLIGRISSNFGCVHPHQHYIRIFGTKGTFIYDDQGPRIHWGRDEAPRIEKLEEAPKPKEKGALIHQFVEEFTKENRKNIAQREFDLMKVVLASDEALNNNQTIEINYDY